MPDELSPSQVAARLGATTRSVQRWIASGSLPARRVGGRWRVASDALDAFTHRGAIAGDARFVAPTVPIRRLLVANRGEIARRVATTSRRLGIEPLVPGVGGLPGVDLLDAGAIVDLARRVDADAVHPGYGFLSEQAPFAEAVMASGIRWVGPPPNALAAMGDKAAARRLAAAAGVPVVRGYDGDDQSDERLAREAERIGYPVLLKPAGGGGGKGMRTVRTADRLADAIAAARREATVAFGDDRLVIEALVEGPRHVEVQVLFDHYGTGVHLGERDCSIQRRHQKVLEEAPSPGVDGALRARLGDAALRLGAEVGYEGAGTCEFLVDDRGTFSFLEMNARLQVEHPVTEGITGRDLVADQLAIAAGSDLAALGLDQAAVDAARATGGHAIEVRLYAEDAEAGFLPSTGRIVELRWPEGAGAFRWDGDVRVDAGIDDGTEVGDRFDPMLAKLLARGATREAALDRLAAALDETVLLGLVTNLRFLRWLVRSPAVRAGQARIDTLDRTWPPDDWAERTALDDEAWATAARALASTLDADDPWSGGWRLNARGRLRVRSDDGQDRMVALDPDADDPAPTRSAATSGATVFVDVAGRSVGFGLAPPPELGRPAARGGGTEDGDTAELTAPMPGLVIAIHAAKGVLVGAGDPVVTIEAMKMEHVVAAPVAGEIADLSIDRGDQVARGQLLGRIEPPAAPER